MLSFLNPHFTFVSGGSSPSGDLLPLNFKCAITLLSLTPVSGWYRSQSFQARKQVAISDLYRVMEVESCHQMLHIGQDWRYVVIIMFCISSYVQLSIMSALLA